ncbi:glycoside hydrolase family 13 protein [Bacillus timonensis]|uniref:glycoside hydrolase family 13 protein n=1 Tax=Bacillus timonensis TaxID=1033734 RepID=UPI00028957C8|nr:alpha-glucosidase [Bacillus timonensis]
MERTWWKESVVYQIYPRSFMDSNNDGIGDLKGITSKLDYLKELGIDVIWLSPIYQSPNDDNGYDISDYQAIMSEFGSMEDFDELLEEAHKRGIKIMMDLVVNHSSDEHQWFLESKSSKDNSKRDYYIWKKGQDGKEPTNWESIFSGSVWEYDETTEEYYLHLFSKKQPDLNWENPKVRKEVYDLMTWWLDKGIDGFRMDVINMISKDQSYPDGEVLEGKKYADGGSYFLNGPRIHEFLQEMNQEVLSKYDIITVGETPGVTTDEAKMYTGSKRNELNMVFQFEHMTVGNGPDGKWDRQPWKLTELKSILSHWQVELEEDGWNSLYWDNHDQPRVVSRFGNDSDEYREISAKMLATCLHMMKGTPYIYQGEELGMTNVEFPSISQYKDIETLNAYEDYVTGNRMSEDEFMEAVYYIGRDNARTPFQWDESENAGFTKGTPWIEVNPNFKQINAQAQVEDVNSVFHYYKKLIQLRKNNSVIVYGNFEELMKDDESIYAYTRTLNDEKLLVICNFTQEQVDFKLPSDLNDTNKQLLISNYDVNENESIEHFSLRPYETRVYKI